MQPDPRGPPSLDLRLLLRLASNATLRTCPCITERLVWGVRMGVANSKPRSAKTVRNENVALSNIQFFFCFFLFVFFR